MHFVNVYCIFLGVVCCASKENEAISYEKAQLWDVPMRNVADIVYIKDLIEKQDIESWHLSSVQADFLVRPGKIKKVKHQLQSRNLSYSVVMKNIQRTVDSQMKVNSVWDETTLRQGHRLDWSAYPPLNIIEEFYNFLTDEYTSLCKLQVIGRTSEGRKIEMINITNGDARNKIIVILAGIHGREWVSITSALYILNKIVADFDEQPDHIQAINWLIVPVLNPDGYNFTRTHNRLWRKNRHYFSNKCIGVDINRNFETNWNVIGITENKCREGYAGPYASSELETTAVRDLIMNLPEKPSALIDIHAYGNAILYPWSAKDEQTEDSYLHKFTANGMVKAIQATSGEKYTHGVTYHKVYPATGSLIDWAYSQGIKHTYAIETRDSGRYGFLLPGNEIEDTGKELFAAIDFLAKSIEPPDMHNNYRRRWF